MTAEAEAVDTSSNVACRRCLPYLKFVRGTGWERKHWTQLFAMLKLVTKVGPPSGDPTCVTVSRHEDACIVLVTCTLHKQHFLLAHHATASDSAKVFVQE